MVILLEKLKNTGTIMGDKYDAPVLLIKNLNTILKYSVTISVLCSVVLESW